MGYGSSFASVMQQVGRPGDGGIDGVIDVDILGRDRLYLQAKSPSRKGVEWSG
jgi:restriction system protein